MSGNSAVDRWLPFVLVGLVVLAAAGLPSLRERELSATSKVTDRLDRLEAEQRRIGRVVKVLGSDLAQVDTRSEGSERLVARVLPSNAQWIDLRSGGKAQWDLEEHGRARIEFLEEEGSTLSVLNFRVSHRAGQITVALAPGQTMRAIDDKGTHQHSYMTTMHRLRLDRSGRPQAALFSVVVED